MEDQILYRFNRNQNETVYFNLHEYKGKKYLDLRVFFQPEDQEEMRPTRKGITIPVDLLGELKKGIASCEKKLSTNNVN
jgi:hypothetical protein